jgi:hypothetical protein
MTAKVSTNTKTKPKEATLNTTQHPLATLIPDKDKWAGDAYISREIGGVRDIDILDAARQSKHNVLLYGPTGSAKTSCVYAYAAEHNLPVVNIPCNGAAEPSIFVGKWTPKPDSTLDFVPGPMVLAAQHGGIVYLDEVNFLPPKIASYLHGLLDRRRVLTIQEAEGSSCPSHVAVHPDCVVIGAYNPDYAGTRPLNQAFKNRFAVKLYFPYDDAIERKLLNSTALQELAGALRGQVDIGSLSTPISTNLLMEVEEWNETLGFDFALHNFIAAFPQEEQQVVHEVLVNYAPKIWDDLNEGDFQQSSEFAITKKKSDSNS